MKITFLGTADGLPRPGHFCTSTMVEVGDRVYLFDAGAPVASLIREHGKKMEDITAFFNTHGHGDHLDGLLQVLDLCSWAYTDASFDLFFPEERVMNACVHYIEGIFPKELSFPHERLRMQVFEEGVVYDDGVLKVSAVATEHCRPRPSYAFVLEAEGKRVLLTGDLRGDAADFPTVIYEREFDLVVCEMAHFGEDEITPIMKKAKARRWIFNHYQERKEAHIERLSVPGRFAFPVKMAKDGESMEI